MIKKSLRKTTFDEVFF